MRFHADLHIHAKYSRATSRDLDLEHLAAWAGRKGITVVGTGDFTHPAWRAELKEKLVPAASGLFRLRPEIEREVARELPAACQTLPQFMLQVEISTIYKKGDRTRKVHHLIYAPDFDTADRFSASLARIGNIASDGRPILGLDSRHLLEIALQSGPDAYLIPAHIWTPWFAALGSQSGFDSIVECYGDLSDHIFAIETGLSSDPSMNWRLSQLDRYRLVSNSDAHSPGKLGREATTFDCDPDYYAIRRSLETGDGYVGTIEFFPEEGKYHHDGHRKCGVRHTPAETMAHGGRCPVCNQPTTVGVLHRVEALADRPEEGVTPPATAGAVSNFVPLPEVIGEIAASGVGTKTVERHYDRLVSVLGAELSILGAVPLEDIARATSSIFAEAITRLRAGQVIREPGYDGEYGIIRLFEETELRTLTAGGLLFDRGPSTSRSSAATPSAVPAAAAAAREVPMAGKTAPTLLEPLLFEQHEIDAMTRPDLLAGLDADQRAAAEVVDGPLLIVAGPGSGKTRTLTHRIAHLIASCGAAPASCLAVTFTRRAAAEMRGRLAALLDGSSPADSIPIHTFHSLGLTILRAHADTAGLPANFRVADEREQIAVLATATGLSESRAKTMMRAMSKATRTQRVEDAAVAEAMRAYQQALAASGCIDFDDLVGLAVQVLSEHPSIAMAWRDRFRWISVDEFQDVDEQQYRLIGLLAPPADVTTTTDRPAANLCVIGDPNQAIYGFRGADASCFDRFAIDYPSASRVALTRNYRSSGTIVTASSQVIAQPTLMPMRPLAEIVREMHERITIHVTPSDRAEAELIVRTIGDLVGGLSLDPGRASTPSASALGFADFAVLYRTSAQATALCDAFARSGIPFATHGHDPLIEQPAVRALLDAFDVVGPSHADSLTIAARLRAAARIVSGASDPSGASDASHAVDAPEIAARELALQRLLALADSCEDADEARFKDVVALATEADFWDPRADRVSLLTLHAAKGLEFAVVFIAGLEDGILPLRWHDGGTSADAEERRLFYVGMTRARDRLILTRALQRPWRGRLRTLDASPFLDAIEQELVKHQQQPAKPARVDPDDRQLRLL